MLELLIFILVSVLLSFIICLASFSLAIKKSYTEKISSYECGFDPFVDSRNKFEIKFFLVAILFIIFDLEISILFPWVQVIIQSSYWIVINFLLILTVGLSYEWNRGALEWE